MLHDFRHKFRIRQYRILLRKVRELMEKLTQAVAALEAQSPAVIADIVAGKGAVANAAKVEAAAAALGDRVNAVVTAQAKALGGG